MVQVKSLLVAHTGTLASYLRGLTRIAAASEGTTSLVFKRQIDATTRSWRALVPLAMVFVIVGICGFWQAANKTGATTGAALILVAAVWGWRAVPADAPSDNLRLMALRHLISAALVGTGWALLGVAVAASASKDLTLLVLVVQMALMAVGLIMYVNLPAGFVAFSTPVAVSLAITSTPVALGGPLVSLSLIATFYVILAKAAVDQSNVFVEAQTAMSRLAQSESERFQMAHDAAEEQARLTVDARTREAEQRVFAVGEAEKLKRASLHQLGTRFDEQVTAAVAVLSDTVTALSRSATRLNAVGEESAGAAADVAARAAAASSSASFVAAAAESLGKNVTDISVRVDKHADLSRTARALASSSVQQINTVCEEAARIDGVIGLVEGVAKQTKALALNATIEAARVGEAGKGFAVVASEIRALAGRTTDATPKVRDQTGAIVSHIGAASGCMTESAEKIDAVAEIASRVASSIAQQRQAAIEIGRETGVVADNVDDVRGRAAELASGAKATSSLAGSMTRDVAEITRQVSALRVTAAEFLEAVLAA